MYPQYTHRPRAAPHGLIISPALVPQCDVIHTSLAGPAHSECLQYDVHNTLGRLHIAPHHSSFRVRVENRTLGQLDFNRGETALREKQEYCIYELPIMHRVAKRCSNTEKDTVPNTVKSDTEVEKVSQCTTSYSWSPFTTGRSWSIFYQNWQLKSVLQKRCKSNFYQNWCPTWESTAK